MDDIGRIARELGEYYKDYSAVFASYSQWLHNLPPHFYEYLREETYHGRSAQEILEDTEKCLHKNYDSLYELANDVLSLAHELESKK